MAASSDSNTYLGYEITEAVAQAVADRYSAANKNIKQIDEVVQNGAGEWEIHFTQLAALDDDPLQPTQKEIYRSKIRVRQLLVESVVGEDLLAETHANA